MPTVGTSAVCPSSMRLSVRTFDRCYLRLVRNVAGNADRSAALDDDPIRLVRGEVAVEIRQHDGGAALGEHARRRQPHAFRGTRDQRHLPFVIVDRVHLKFTPRCVIAKTWRVRQAGKFHLMRSTRRVTGPGRSNIETSSITRPSKIIPG